MAFEALSATLSASDGVSGSLTDIRDSALEAAGSATTAGQTFDEFAEELDDTGDEATRTSGLLAGLRSAVESVDGSDADIDVDTSSIPAATVAASETLDELELRIDSAADEARGFTSVLNGLDGAEREAASGAVDTSDTLRELALRLRQADDVADDLEAELGQLDNAAAELLSQSLESAAGIQTLQGRIDEAGDEAAQAARQVDGFGDEALSASAKASLLGESLDDAGRGASSLFSSFGPVSGRLSRLAPLIAAAIPLLGGLATSFGGAATAAGGFGGALGGIAFGGLLNKGEELAATNEDIADASEGLEQIFATFGQEAKDALEPLQNAANTEFALSGLGGAIRLLSEAAETADDLAPTIRSVGGALGEDVLETAPELFDELETSVRSAAPAIESLGGIIRATPDAIAFLRSELQQIGPQVGAFTGQLFRLLVVVSDLGSDILRVLLPAVTALTGALAFIIGIAAAVPEPLQAAAIAAIATAGAYVAYGSAAGIAAAATGALTTALGVLTAPITGTIALIAAAVGAVVAIIDFFGLWREAITALFVPLTIITGLVELIIQAIIGAINAISEFLGMGQQIEAPEMGSLTVTGDEVATAISGNERDDGGDGGGPSGPSSPGSMQTRPGQAAAQRASAGDPSGDNYDFSNANFGGQQPSETKRQVKQAVKEANREDRAREDGRGG